MPSSACDWSSDVRSEEHTSELQSHSEISYAVFCLKQKKYHCVRGDDADGGRAAHHHVAYRRRGVPRAAQFQFLLLFFFNATATTEIYTNLNTLSLHDALPIYSSHIQKSRMPSSACDWS